MFSGKNRIRKNSMQSAIAIEISWLIVGSFSAAFILKSLQKSYLIVGLAANKNAV